MKMYGWYLGFNILAVLFVATMVPQAAAHDLWLELRDYTPAPGEHVSLTLAYGHHFPARGFMDLNRLEKIYALDQAGHEIGVNSSSNLEFRSKEPFKTKGTYLVVAENKAGFSTKTTEGYRGHSKKGLQNVIQCSYSAKYSKAIVNVGDAGGGTYSKVLGHDLEIVPLVDLGTLKEGDYLMLKVLYGGKPLASSQVLGTYMGFSTEKNTFAYATKTDKVGLAKMKMLSSGVWLVTTSHVEDYPDPSECDQYKFSATLTFEIE